MELPPIINGDMIASIIASSTTGYMGQFSPVFILIGGVILAVGVISVLIDRFFPQSINVQGFDFQKAEELKEFYNRRGKNDSAWDWTNMHE